MALLSSGALPTNEKQRVGIKNKLLRNIQIDFIFNVYYLLSFHFSVFLGMRLQQSRIGK